MHIWKRSLTLALATSWILIGWAGVLHAAEPVRLEAALVSPGELESRPVELKRDASARGGGMQSILAKVADHFAQCVGVARNARNGSGLKAQGHSLLFRLQLQPGRYRLCQLTYVDRLTSQLHATCQTQKLLYRIVDASDLRT